MTLSDYLIAVALICGAYAAGTWAWSNWGSKQFESVKKKAPRVGFKKRSQGSNVQNVQNVVNAGSGHQDAAPERSDVQSVQASTSMLESPAGAMSLEAGTFTLTIRELAQLGEAINLRREGCTVEEALSRAFGVTKGGSEGYKRAKAIFDAATVTPGAAPAGTYTATPRPRRRRAVAR